jgi:hypothetical protein
MDNSSSSVHGDGDDDEQDPRKMCQGCGKETFVDDKCASCGLGVEWALRVVDQQPYYHYYHYCCSMLQDKKEKDEKEKDEKEKGGDGKNEKEKDEDGKDEKVKEKEQTMGNEKNNEQFFLGIGRERDGGISYRMFLALYTALLVDFVLFSCVGGFRASINMNEGLLPSWGFHMVMHIGVLWVIPHMYPFHYAWLMKRNPSKKMTEFLKQALEEEKIKYSEFVQYYVIFLFLAVAMSVLAGFTIAFHAMTNFKYWNDKYVMWMDTHFIVVALCCLGLRRTWYIAPHHYHRFSDTLFGCWCWGWQWWWWCSSIFFDCPSCCPLCCEMNKEKGRRRRRVSQREEELTEPLLV